jgi:NADPH:quinone reductase-like Zn-dependent oxidoreductase
MTNATRAEGGGTWRRVVVERFGGPEVLELRRVEPETPGPGQVVVRLTSIGLNHADLMGRRGKYRLSTGDPPFTPGLEGGGVIESVGEGVDVGRIGQRVILAPDASRLGGPVAGTYASHVVCSAASALPAPDALPDNQLGAIWLPYLTAWGCLQWKQRVRPGQIVALPAASSSTALAAGQLARAAGCTTIGLTTSPGKTEAIADRYDHLVVTHEEVDGERRMRPWHRDLRRLTDGRGVDVFYDPVASGPYLETEIKSLADGGTVWVYGLLGSPGPVDVTPLIRKHAAIRGWALSELVDAGQEAWRPGAEFLLDHLANSNLQQTLGGRFTLDQVQEAHTAMARGQHIGKLVLVP